jgi:hypothetical protein
MPYTFYFGGFLPFLAGGRRFSIVCGHGFIGAVRALLQLRFQRLLNVTDLHKTTN